MKRNARKCENSGAPGQSAVPRFFSVALSVHPTDGRACTVLNLLTNSSVKSRKNPVEKLLEKWGIKHILIPPITPWHNGKVERSHRNDQRYFYDWEHFCSVEELNEKLKAHLEWSNNKTMRTLGRKSPIQLLREKLGALASTAP